VAAKGLTEVHEPISVARDSVADTSLVRLATAYAIGPLLLLVLLLAVATIYLCQGHFVYSLDDPYISLQLGWEIAHGHYGLEAGESSSPSSSILYPFMLAAFARTGFFFNWVPLIVNALASCATAVVFARMLLHFGVLQRRAELAAASVLVVALCIALNIVGVVFTGLEHSLHVLVTVAIIYGLARALQEHGTAPPWLIFCIVINPLLRFEGLALSGLCLLALLWAGQWRRAVAAGLMIGVLLGSYMAGMLLQGLPVLPSSVLVKAPAVASTHLGGLYHIKSAITELLRYRPAISLWIALLSVILHPLLRRRGTLQPRSISDALPLRSECVLIAVVAVAVGAHAFMAQWGWWYRYETYLLAMTGAAAIVVWSAQLRDFLATANPPKVLLVTLILLAVFFPYTRATVLDPEASRGIYEEQYQMRRFAVEFYRQPVAANDIGLLTYQNPNYVLDLWGLASETARKARLVTHEPGWMDKLAHLHRVGLAMVYPNWFRGQIPTTWVQVGTLRTLHKAPSADQDAVVFFVTDPSNTASAIAALSQLKQATRGSADVSIR
jgi:hypothetical protein